MEFALVSGLHSCYFAAPPTGRTILPAERLRFRPGRPRQRGAGGRCVDPDGDAVVGGDEEAGTVRTAGTWPARRPSTNTPCAATPPCARACAASGGTAARAGFGPRRTSGPGGPGTGPAERQARQTPLRQTRRATQRRRAPRKSHRTRLTDARAPHRVVEQEIPAGVPARLAETVRAGVNHDTWCGVVRLVRPDRRRGPVLEPVLVARSEHSQRIRARGRPNRSHRASGEVQARRPGPDSRTHASPTRRSRSNRDP